MRYFLSLFYSFLILNGLFAQPLQFIDKTDTLPFNAIDLVGNNRGGWFTLGQTGDSSFQVTIFDHCGKVDACTKTNLPAGMKLYTPQVAYIGMDKYLVAATLKDSSGSQILIFYYENGAITQAKLIRSLNNTNNYNPLLSVYKEDKILLAFNYVSGAFGSSRVLLLDKQLNVRWSKHIQQESHIRWARMINDNEFVIGDIDKVMKYDTTGKNIWSRNFADHFMMYNSVLVNDSNIIFAVDYVNPVFDTSTIKKPRYKKVINLNMKGEIIWESAWIRSLRNGNLNLEFNSHLAFDNNNAVLLNTIDTVGGDLNTAVFAHTLSETGKIRSSKYWSSRGLISDYKSSILNDGNFAVGICLIDSAKTATAFLNVKTSMKYEACETKSFVDTIPHFVKMDTLKLQNLPDSAVRSLSFSFRVAEDSLKSTRFCEVFDLKDSEVPTPLCKGDSVFLAGLMLPNASYVWSNGSKQSGTWVKEEGTYSLMITYCNKTVTITYKVFYITFADENILREECDYPLRLNANRGNDAKYLWANGETTDFLDVSGPGTYTVNVTKCEMTFKINFTVRLKTFTDQTTNYEICDYPFNLYATQGKAVVYKWNDGSTDGKLTIFGPGTYKVTVSYCQSTFVETWNVTTRKFQNETNTFTVCDYPFELFGYQGPGINGVVYKWDNGSTDGARKVSGPGTYKVTVNYCQTSFVQTFILKIKDRPLDETRLFNISCDTLDAGYILNPQRSNSSFRWSDGSTRSILLINHPGTYKVTVTECLDSNVISFKVSGIDEEILKFPNVFLPNSELADNKVFKPLILNDTLITNYHLVIFNRWGQKVFESKNKSLGWDGNFKGVAAPVETYMYYATIETKCLPVKTYKGSVTLVK